MSVHIWSYSSPHFAPFRLNTEIYWVSIRLESQCPEQLSIRTLFTQWTTCFYLILSIFKKQKRGLELVFLPHFLHSFSKKSYFSCYRPLTKFHGLVAFTSGDIGQYVYCNCLSTRLWSQKFWNYPYLSNQADFSTWPKCHDKNLNILRTKRALKMK